MVNIFINDSEEEVPSNPFRFLANNSLPTDVNWNKALKLQEKACKITQVFM